MKDKIDIQEILYSIQKKINEEMEVFDADKARKNILSAQDLAQIYITD